MQTLSIQNLHVSVEGQKILKGINLTVRPGEIHALMGPNGSGKSTLGQAVMGHPGLNISEGRIFLGEKKISDLSPTERANLGIFLAFQYPVEVPGVALVNFLRQALNARSNRVKPTNLRAFRNGLLEKLQELDLDESFLSRGLNEGFSGGEKKKMEILQLAILAPKVAILDETDSGLDIDSLKIVAQSVQKITQERLAQKNPLGILLITHYRRILDYLKPNFVHVMVNGQIVRSGGSEIVAELEEGGYVKYTKGG